MERTRAVCLDQYGQAKPSARVVTVMEVSFMLRSFKIVQ